MTSQNEIKSERCLHRLVQQSHLASHCAYPLLLACANIGIDGMERGQARKHRKLCGRVL